MAFLLPTIVLVSLIGRSVSREITAVVNTSTGPVQGEIYTSVHSTKYAAFKGIRYAEPPFGYLRFQPPVPIKPWTEVLNATIDGSDCPQYNETTSYVDGSEDCLFLNVYTPVTNLSQTPTELKAVMVWIYGGAFVSGSSATENNRPDFLIERDVVMISFNYRVGALGFLNLGHPNATGNAGLKDQNLALQWVQANIQKFGGNPRNVTIFGCSTGAIAVGFQILSEKSAGLFHGAISMSGTPLVPWGFTNRAEAIERAEALARLLGAFPSTKRQYLKALYAATAEELVELAFVVHMATPFTPTLEDESLTSDPFISECSIQKYEHGYFNKVPQLLGFMDQETVADVEYLEKFVGLVDQAYELINMVGIETLQMLPRPDLQALESEVAYSPDEIQSEDSIESLDSTSRQSEMDDHGSNQFYRPVDNGLLRRAINLSTDALFKLQIDETQRLLSNHMGSVPIYYYDNTFDSPRSRHNIGSKHPVYGAAHADDLFYMFYMPANNYNLSTKDPMGLMIHRITTMWTNFAKYGDPTPHWIDQYPLNVTWPPSGESGQALEIGHELKMTQRPIDSITELLQTLLRPFLPQLNDC